MPRRAEIQARTLDPDPVYNSRLVTQIINRVMVGGKRSTAEKIVYGALDTVGEKSGKPPPTSSQGNHAFRFSFRQPPEGGHYSRRLFRGRRGLNLRVWPQPFRRPVVRHSPPASGPKTSR